MTDDTAWGRFGHYGARGERSADLLAAEIRARADRVSEERYGRFYQKVRYLMASATGLERLRTAVPKGRETYRRWRLGTQQPANTAAGRAERARVEAAFHQLRYERTVGRVIKALERNGRGSRVEILAVDQSAVEPGRERDYVEQVARDARFNVLHWGDLVRAALFGDEESMRLTWDDVLEDAGGSDWHLLQWADNVEILAY